MYLAFIDEADYAAVNSFTVCGLTAIPIHSATSLSLCIEEIRKSIGNYGPTDLLKSSGNSKPQHVSPKEHTKIKNAVMKTAAEHDVIFLAYCKFNEEHEAHDATRNRVFGFNTLLGKFNDFLNEVEATGIVLLDRLDFNHDDFGNGFSFLKEKFQKGNHYPREDSWRQLSNILSFSMYCEGSSHLASLNDILTGGFRYIVNGPHEEAKRAIKANLDKLLWSDNEGKVQERGFTMRPYNKRVLSPAVKSEYTALQSFMNT